MPTYQYVCTDCASDLEAVQSFSEPSLAECPSCGGKLRKRFGAVGVVFKGSGFYRNDSRSDRPGGANGTKPETGDKAASSDSGAKTETKSEPAAKSSTSSDSSSSSSSSGGAGSGSSASSGSSSGSSGSSTKTSSAA